MKKGHVCYYGDGRGRWVKVTVARQCGHDIIWGECQGKDGHEGPCWCYGQDGSFHQNFMRLSKEESKGIGAMDFPPGSRGWVSPVEMYNSHYSRFRDEEVVTDQEEIDRLNRGEHPRGTSINIPYVWGENPKRDKKFRDRMREFEREQEGGGV